MNINKPLKIKVIGIIQILACISLSVFVLTAKAQGTDTIVPIKTNPEKILKNLDIKSITRNGFNFWQDDFEGHWAGIDFGFNALLNPDYSGYDKDFMKNDIVRSNSLYINLIQQSIGLQHNRNTIGLVTGLGMHFQSYRLDQNTTIELNPYDVVIPKTLYFDDNQKSKLSIFSLTVPLLAEFQIPINNYQNRLYFSTGPFVSYRIASHTKIKYRTTQKEKLKVPDHYSLHNFKYGMMVRTGYRRLNVFASVELTNLFLDDKGPELAPFTFGFTVLRF